MGDATASAAQPSYRLQKRGLMDTTSREDRSLHDDLVVSLDDDNLLRGLSDLRWHLDELLAGRAPVLVVDISGLSRLSSATLAALLWAQRGCRSRGGGVLLRGPNRRCRDVLARTGLIDLFSVDADDLQPMRAGAGTGGRRT
jgi:anti-sigma B factor antagonist